MQPNPYFSALRRGEQVRRARRRLRSEAIKNPPLTAFLEIVDGGKAIRNHHADPIPCRLVVAWIDRVIDDAVAEIPPAGCDYHLPNGAEAMAVLPLGATVDDFILAVEKAGFSYTGEVDPNAA